MLHRLVDNFRLCDAGDGTVDRSVLEGVLHRLDPVRWTSGAIDKLVNSDWVPKNDAGRVRYVPFVSKLLGEEHSDASSSARDRGSLLQSVKQFSLAAALRKKNRPATSLSEGIVKGYLHWHDDNAVVIRCRQEDFEVASMLKIVLSECQLKTEVQVDLESESTELTIWLMTPQWNDEDLCNCERHFKRESAVVICPAGLEMNAWAARMSAQGLRGPMITMSISYEMLMNASVRDLDIMTVKWMAQLWTKLMKLQGAKSYRHEHDICQNIDQLLRSPVGRLPSGRPTEPKRCEDESSPHIVGFIGSTTFFKPWTNRLCRYVAAELSQINQDEKDSEIVVLTGGFYNRLNEKEVDDQGVGYTVAAEYDRLGGRVVHILPEIARDKDYSAQAAHLPDGSFLPLSFGTSIFAGETNEEHLVMMSKACDVVFLLEGGLGASIQAKAAMESDHVPVVPIRATGGAASGMFNLPKVKRMFHIDEESWAAVADERIEPVEEMGEEEMKAIARAISQITRDTLHPVSSTNRGLRRSKVTEDELTPAAYSLPERVGTSSITRLLNGAIVSNEVQLPPWSLSRDEFMAPLDVVNSDSLSPLYSLLLLCERPLRVYGRWNYRQERRLLHLLNCLREFLTTYVEQNKSNRYISLMTEAYKVKAKKFRRVYSTVVQDVISQEEAFPGFSVLAAEVAHEVAARNPPTKQFGGAEAKDGLELLLEVYESAHSADSMLQNFCADIAKKSGTRFVKVPLKRMWRSLEKLVLKYSSRAGAFATAALDLKDVARAALEGTMAQLSAALAAMRACGDVEIVRIKNRFAQPSTMGWADCQVMLYFRNSTSKHICEIQLVHPQLMIVRKGMGAHHEYKSIRAAEELMTLYDVTVPKLQEERIMYLCDARPGSLPSFPAQLEGKQEPAFSGLAAFRAVVDESDVLSANVASEFDSGSAARLSLAFGIADPLLQAGGRLSLRWESEEFVCFDSASRSFSPLHVIVMPTATYIPCWRALLLQPTMALGLLSKMRRVGEEVTSKFLEHAAWRDYFFRAPAAGWPDVGDADAVKAFCRKHVVCGFMWPNLEKQLSLHWIMLPMYPSGFVQRDYLLGSGHFIPLDFVEGLLNKGCVDEATVAAIIQKQSCKSILESIGCLEDYAAHHDTVMRQCASSGEELAQWHKIFQSTAVDGESVWTVDACGVWTVDAAADVKSVQERDNRRLGSFGQPYEGPKPSGTFYSFPTLPREMRRDFLLSGC